MEALSDFGYIRCCLFPLVVFPFARAVCDLKLWFSIFALFGRLFVLVSPMTFLFFLGFFLALICQPFFDDSPAITLIFFYSAANKVYPMSVGEYYVFVITNICMYTLLIYSGKVYTCYIITCIIMTTINKCSSILYSVFVPIFCKFPCLHFYFWFFGLTFNLPP